MEVKTEADSCDITQCSYDDEPTVGTFAFYGCPDVFPVR